MGRRSTAECSRCLSTGVRADWRSCRLISTPSAWPSRISTLGTGGSGARVVSRRWRYSLTQAEVRELLDAFAFVRFGDEEVALRIDGEVVRAVELASPVPRTAEFADHLQRLPLEDVDALIRAVGN